MGQRAARKGDPTVHTTTLNGVACLTVKIGGSDAWRVGDMHTCSMQNTLPPAPAPIPHVGGAVLKGSFGVLIDSKPAAREGDFVLEPAASPPTVPFPPNNTIMLGAPTVEIGDLQFGLVVRAIMEQFCKDWTQLRKDWATLTPDQRKQRTKEMLDRALTSAGNPPLDSVTDTARAGANGSFSSVANEVKLPKGFFDGPVPPGEVGQTLFHEARHATQYMNTARTLAGQGKTAAEIAQSTGMSQTLANAGAANPAAAGTAEAVHGQMNHDQTFGKGKLGSRYNRQAREYIKSPEANSSQAAYDKAYKAYFGLPNEADAKDAQNAFAALCPQAREGAAAPEAAPAPVSLPPVGS